VPFDVRADHWDSPAATVLRTAQQAEIRGIYGQDTEPGVTPSAEDIDLFLVAWDAARAVGCGGLRRLDATTGEIKRMYVVPSARGSGVADAVLAALEDAARGFGWAHLRLETGDRLDAAQAFYRRAGYRPIENFGPYAGEPVSRCFERDLSR
jgi:GNAT superfamily N-acetyltransferase